MVQKETKSFIQIYRRNKGSNDWLLWAHLLLMERQHGTWSVISSVTPINEVYVHWGWNQVILRLYINESIFYKSRPGHSDIRNVLEVILMCKVCCFREFASDMSISGRCSRILLGQLSHGIYCIILLSVSSCYTSSTNLSMAVKIFILSRVVLRANSMLETS